MRNLRIAVVDDDRLIRRFVTHAMMHFSGGHVLSFGDGSAAWEFLEIDDALDIIISDVEMPGMDGIELLSRIRERFPDKVCIMISADHSYRATALALGANGFLAKPFTVHDLISAVEPYMESYCPPRADAS